MDLVLSLPLIELQKKREYLPLDLKKKLALFFSMSITTKTDENYAQEIVSRLTVVIREAKGQEPRKATLVVADTYEEAAEIVTKKSVECGYVPNNEESTEKFKKDEIDVWRNRSSAGATFPDLDLIVISLQKIREKFPQNDET